MTPTRRWSALAVLVIVAVLAAGWFLLVVPKRTEASEIRIQTETQQESNSRLRQQLSVLKAQQADLPAQLARLSVLRRQIPDNPALPDLVRSLTSAAAEVGVSLDTISPAAPVAVVVPVPLVPVAPTTTEGATDTSTGTSDPDTAVPPAPVPAVAPTPALYQVPIALTITGSYFELEQYVNKLEGLKRSFLVTGFTLGQPTGEAAAGSDVTISLQGRVFLNPPAATTAPTTPVAPAATSQ